MFLVDARQTRDIQNGRCVQFKVHFYGPVATKIEQDLSRLLSKGQLDSPTIQVHGAHADPKRSKTIPYHVCDESDNGICILSPSYIILYVTMVSYLFLVSPRQPLNGAPTIFPSVLYFLLTIPSIILTINLSNLI